MFHNSYNYGLKDSVSPFYTDQERGSVVKYCNYNDYESEADICQENTFYKWQNPTTLNKSSTFSRCLSGNDSSGITLPHMNKKEPIFQIEYGILLSELLKECHLRLEDLKISKNQVECTVMKENGQLKNFIIQRNAQDPYQYLTQYNIRHDCGLPIVKTSGKEPKHPEMKDLSPTKFRHGLLAPMYKSHENDSRNKNTNKKLLTSSKHFGSSCTGNSPGSEHSKFDYAPYAKHMHNHSGNKSNDLSLYEETRQYNTGDGKTIERYQQYKIRPTKDKCSNVVQNGEDLIYRHDSKISPQVSLAERRCIEKQSEPISKTKFDLQFPTLGESLTLKDSTLLLVDNEPLNEIGHDHTVQRDIICLQPINNSSDSKPNLTLNARSHKKEPEQSSTLSEHGTVIPHIKFVKPQVRQLSSNSMKGHIFSSKRTLNKSESQIRKECFKEPSTMFSSIRYVNQSRKLKSIGISKGRSLVTVDGHKYPLFQTQLTYEVEKATTEGLTSKSTLKEKEYASRDRINSGFFSTNRVAEGMLHILETGPNQTFQERPSHSITTGVHKADMYSASKEYAIPLRTGLENKYELNFSNEILVTRAQKGPLKNKQENETQEPITYTTIQTDDKVLKEDKHIYNLRGIKGQTSTPSSSVKSLARANAVDYKFIVNKPCGALNNRLSEGNVIYKTDSVSMSDNRESIHFTTDTVAQVNMSAPSSIMIEASIDQNGSLSETKEHQLSRLKNQIGKISSTNGEDQTVKENLLWPQNNSKSIKNNSDDSPELLWHKQKLRQGREAYLPNYKVGKCTRPLVKENIIKRPISISNWGYEAKSHHNMENRQVNQVESSPSVSDKTVSKKIENKSTDNDQCSIM